MHAFGIQPLFVSHLEQGFQHIATDFGGTGCTGDTKSIATTGNFHIQAAFDLSQVFVELATEIGQTLVIGGLEDQVPRNLDRIQSTKEVTAKRWGWEVRQAAA